MKAIPCTIIFNTKWGYIMQPIKCESIRAALRLAEDCGMIFRIFVNGKCIRRGWYTR